MKIKVWHILLFILIGFLLGWWLSPNKITEKFLPGKTHVQWITDTVKTQDSISFPVYKYIPKEITRVDTVFKETGRDYTDLITRYDAIADSLKSMHFARILDFQEVTDEGDSLNIKFEAVRDSIMDFELKLATRKFMKDRISTYYVPDNNQEEWWIKPAIAIGALGIGYAVRGNE